MRLPIEQAELLVHALTIAETVRALPEPSALLRVTRQTSVSAQIDGGNTAGYLKAAVEKPEMNDRGSS